MNDLSAKREQLLQTLADLKSCAVAFSAGVDSTVLAKAAQLALGDRAVAVTGTSASMAEGELEEAVALAKQIGIRHVIFQTDEFNQPDYLRNAPDRCYHCKTELYTQIGSRLTELGVSVIANGANVDDRGDYRPGMTAAAEHRVVSPLADCGFTKADVRELAREWELPVWDKPATPCLSSRVAYGENVTPEKLRMIDAAERHLREAGLATVRVRYHAGDLARLEIPSDAITQIVEPTIRRTLITKLRELGFKFVTLDLEGFRSGSLNQLVQLQSSV